MTSMCQPTATRLECSACGATADAACGCGAPYMPAGTRAAKAVAANPEKSDRAIADELGVGHATVSRARKKATVSGDTVGKRVGKDGKVRKLPAPAHRPAIDDRAAFLSRVDQAVRLAFYAGPIPASQDDIAAARKAAAAWTALAADLAEKPTGACADTSMSKVETIEQPVTATDIATVEQLLADLEIGGDESESATAV